MCAEKIPRNSAAHHTVEALPYSKWRRVHRPSPSLPKPNSVEVPHLLLIPMKKGKKVKCSIFKPAANHASPKAQSQVILLFIPH